MLPFTPSRVYVNFDESPELDAEGQPSPYNESALTPQTTAPNRIVEVEDDDEARSWFQKKRWLVPCVMVVSIIGLWAATGSDPEPKQTKIFSLTPTAEIPTERVEPSVPAPTANEQQPSLTTDASAEPLTIVAGPTEN